jgi:hypothetical protein
MKPLFSSFPPFGRGLYRYACWVQTQPICHDARSKNISYWALEDFASPRLSLSTGWCVQNELLFLCGGWRNQALHTGGSGGIGGLGNGRGGGWGGSGSGIGPGPGSGRWKTNRSGELETVNLIPESLRAHR